MERARILGAGAREVGARDAGAKDIGSMDFSEVFSRNFRIQKTHRMSVEIPSVWNLPRMCVC